MITRASTSRIFARPAKQWGVAGGRVCTSTTFFWTILLCDAAVAQLYRGKLLPLTPGEPRQREFAFRAGVNIVMYTLTGNYKADQVHVPQLLERLGQ